MTRRARRGGRGRPCHPSVPHPGSEHAVKLFHSQHQTLGGIFWVEASLGNNGIWVRENNLRCPPGIEMCAKYAHRASQIASPFPCPAPLPREACPPLEFNLFTIRKGR